MTMRRAAGAQSTGGVEVFAIAQGHDLRADQAGVPAAASNGEGQHQISKPGPGNSAKAMASRMPGRKRKVFTATVVRAVSTHPPE